MQHLSHDSATRKHLGRIYAEENRKFACHATNPASFESWSARARTELRRIIGLDVIAVGAGDSPAKVEMEETEVMEGYTRQRCRILTEPDYWLSFWLLIPEGDGPFPLAVLPHGHDKNGMDTYVGIPKDAAHEEKIRRDDRDVAIQAVRRGFVAVSPEVRGQGNAGIPDINGRHNNSDCRSQMLHAILAGRTATGERVWDMMRLIDWAQTLPEIDDSTVLMMGNSGGGMVSLFTAAVDTRVTISIPSSSFCLFVSPRGVISHCDCNAVPGMLRFGEIWDVAALVAPRALCIVNGREDPLFLNEEVDFAVKQTKALFSIAGASNRIEHHYGPGGHRFYSGLMWPFVERMLSPNRTTPLL